MNAGKLTYPLKASLTVRVPEDLLEKARAKSHETGTTLSHIVRRALEEWVETKR